MRKRNLEHFLPRVKFRTEGNPGVGLRFTEDEMFFICDGVQIAKRGRQAQALDNPGVTGWRVLEHGAEMIEVIRPR